MRSISDRMDRLMSVQVASGAPICAFQLAPQDFQELMVVVRPLLVGRAFPPGKAEYRGIPVSSGSLVSVGRTWPLSGRVGGIAVLPPRRADR